MCAEVKETESGRYRLGEQRNEGEGKNLRGNFWEERYNDEIKNKE